MRKSRRKGLIYILLLIVLLVVAAVFIEKSDTVRKILYPMKYKEQVLKYSTENNLDPYLVFAVIKAESKFNPNAKSGKNAMGLMQIAEVTGKWGAEQLKIEGFSKDDLFNPDINIRIGCWYLGRLMREFDNNVELVIAAYNGGSGNVRNWLQNETLSSDGENLEKIPFPETAKFLKKVKSYYSQYKSLYE